MRKSMRKANAALKDAYKYIASLNEKGNVKPVVQPQKPVVKPIEQPQTPKTEAVFVSSNRGKRIDSAEIKKLDKGHFFIVATCDGKRIEIQKRFKSVTKAQEWLSKNKYIKE